MAYTAIDDPSAHHQIAEYTGTNADNAITNDGNSNLQPDMLWVKNRGAAQNHVLFDSSRGFNGDSDSLLIVPNESDAESHNDNDHLKSFNSDGFTMQGASGRSNNDGIAYVAWQWKANGGTRTTNTESGNNPAGGYQVNTTAGFSIVDYTGTGAAGTMAHGLGAVPDLIIVKNRDAADPWAVYHSGNTSAPETDYLVLNTTAVTVDNATYWNDTAPTSSVFTVTSAHNVNADAENYIAYLWTEKQGYSKFGFYSGNSSVDGTFVYTGFKPAYLMVKGATNISSWNIHDNKRQTYNDGTIPYFKVNNSGAEYSALNMDFVSNGFKLRTSDNDWNGANTYIYMAFAAEPFVTSGGVPCTAR